MKHIILALLTLALFTTACAQEPAQVTNAGLIVRGEAGEKNYTVEDLMALGAVQAVLDDVTYVGVPLATLLQDAGMQPELLTSVTVTAIDNFSATYEPSIFLREDTLVAFARADGPLQANEGLFRMVVPNQGGFMNPRLLAEIVAIQ